MEHYMQYILEQVQKLLAIDSPSGYTEKVKDYLLKEYRSLGYSPMETVKGGVLTELGGEGNGLLLSAHVDTLGGMVHEIKEHGGLKISPIGGLSPINTESENCRIYTFDDICYEGTFQLENASTHVNDDYKEIKRTFETMEVVIDEPVSSDDDVKKLGIMTGNYVCFDPRTVITSSGYIKSRFLDDKLSTAILLGYAKYIKEEKITLPRKVYQHITVFEEVGHGGRASVPADVTEMIAVDMGCVGKGLTCTEREVSICAKDSSGPSNYDILRRLIKAAKDNQIGFAVDIYPHYGSDADAALGAGYDLRHGLIGPGVYASHGYERSHKDGVLNTLKLIKAFIQ